MFRNALQTYKVVLIWW